MGRVRRVFFSGARWANASLLATILTGLFACGSEGDGGDTTGAGGGATGTGGAATGGKAAMGTGGKAAMGTGGSGGMPAPGGSSCYGPADLAIDAAALPDGFCAWDYATEVSDARGITIDAEGNLLVVARGQGAIVALFDDDGDGVSGDGERVTLASADGLNHGIAIEGGYLYASSDTTVYRWPYAADREPLGSAEVVVDGIPGGGHSTRTLAFDAEGFLYVSVGSGGNLDSDSSRARVRRFAASDFGGGAVDFGEGEVWADGMRNEVGLRFDAQGRLWGVENGSDELMRADLGGDIHEDNPGEELNMFDPGGRFYGYPYCWSEFLLPDDLGMGPSTQWAYNPDHATYTDAWCQDTGNVVPPVLSMQAHSAPLDLIFYTGASFPGMTGDVFVAFHGSWNRSAATGYKVVHIPFGSDGMPDGAVEDFFRFDGASARDPEEWPHRPVGLAVGTRGELFVTSDASSRVIAIGYEMP